MQNNVMFGITGVVIGLFVGNMLSGPNLDGIEASIGEGSAAAGETSAKLTALDERIAAIESAVSSNAEQSGAASEALTTKIDGAMASLSDTVKTTVESAGASNADRLEAAFGSQIGEMGNQLKGEIGGLGDEIGSSLGSLKDSLPALAAAAGTAGVAAAAASSPAPSTDDAPATPAATAPSEPEIDGLKPGQTEMLADGKIRVFLSGINQDTGIARIAVNGLGLVDLGGYENVDVEVDGKSCALMLEGIVDGHAQIAAECPE